MKQPETVLKEQVLRDLKPLPSVWVVKIQQVAIRGTPDLLLCVNGHFVALELKRDPKQKPDPLQEYTIDKIKKAGGTALVVHPLNWPDVFRKIAKLANFDDPKPGLSQEVA